ncbi:MULTISPECIES: glycosyltransferase family 2 protein [unclassified Corallococcus]|uniref:glycosyltransferase family 2 protein n=1 Tax=unclassified Corallococcus TaxID=2685029 RepID=UPI001A8C8CE9|nr:MULTISPECIES: glycosyltransferase family A protein [unclassified Corallococcus]MBN9685637.1 glycosyltransferase family 2 protein [Corallococcus sp. NCSPR001]WAS82917.1 glycosyltransferase family A protein [Corallococcus sp. NCRR]
MKRKVTVIMRSKDSAWVIGQALSGLCSQARRDFELLVVDSGSRDATLDIVSRFPARLIRIEAKAYFPGAVLNRAIREATGDLVVFQNSDVVPLTPEALDRLLAPIERGEADATFARQLPRPEAHTWVRRDYAVAFPEKGEAPPWMTYSLPFAAMTREAWRKHPFYEDAWGSEDTEWGHWARNHGLRVRYVPDALVMHSHNYTLKQLYGRRFIEGEADAFILGDRASLMGLARRVGTSWARDAAVHLQARDAAGLALCLPRRLVYHWAWWKGHQWGEKRLRSGNTDPSLGQQVVLRRQ